MQPPLLPSSSRTSSSKTRIPYPLHSDFLHSSPQPGTTSIQLAVLTTLPIPGNSYKQKGFRDSSAGKESTCSAGDLGLIPGWKIPWRRERLPTPGFWPGEFHGLCSPWGCKESDATERLSLSHKQNHAAFALSCLADFTEHSVSKEHVSELCSLIRLTNTSSVYALHSLSTHSCLMDIPVLAIVNSAGMDIGVKVLDQSVFNLQEYLAFYLIRRI